MTLGRRLQVALDYGGWGILAFRDEMRERLKSTDVKGYTHPAIKRYLDDKAEPSLAFLREAADLLDVRYPWLVVEQGAMTETEEMERVAAATLTAAASSIHGPAPSSTEAAHRETGPEDVRRVFGPVLPSVMTALGLPASASIPGWVGGLNEIERQLPESVWKDETGLHPVAKVLRLPIDAFGIEMEAMPDEVLDQYVFGMIPGLLVLAQEAGDQRAERGMDGGREESR